MNNNSCQCENLPVASRHVSRLLVAKYRLQWHLQREGFLWTLRRLLSLLVSRSLAVAGFQEDDATSEVRTAQVESLDLKPGERVRVKSEDEILKTLDGSGRNRGLGFMPGMREYCSREMRVFKPVRKMILESTGELRKVKNTVLLENSMCQGVGMECDRSCFYFWREAWLTRLEETPLDQGHNQPQP